MRWSRFSRSSTITKIPADGFNIATSKIHIVISKDSRLPDNQFRIDCYRINNSRSSHRFRRNRIPHRINTNNIKLILLIISQPFNHIFFQCCVIQFDNLIAGTYGNLIIRKPFAGRLLPSQPDFLVSR